MSIRRLNTRVVVMGLGHIGLPMAALSAAAGFDVVGVDCDPDIVAAVNAGRHLPAEPGLMHRVRDATFRGRLRAQDVPVEAEVYLIAVPTPLGPNGTADLSAVQAAAQSIAPFTTPESLVCVESTVPVGSTERIAEWITQPGGATPLIAHCPERCSPGTAIDELQRIPRIIGGLTPEAATRASAYYTRVLGTPAHITDARTAEAVKLAENSARDVQIAYANELAALCSKAGVDAGDVIRLANQHPRVDILTPGIGVGGHCLPVDPWFLAQVDPAEARMIRAARTTNDLQPARVAKAIADRLRKITHRRRPRLAMLGLSFKPDVADLRGSPALAILHRLLGLGCEIEVADPHLETLPQELRLAGVKLDTAQSIIERADLVVGLVAHREFRVLSVPALTEILDFAGLGLTLQADGAQADAPTPIDHKSLG